MTFRIQACNPKILSPRDRQVADLAAAIQAIFRPATEDAFLLWNGVPIRINYKYDLSVLIDDLLPLLDTLLSSTTGSRLVYWGSDTFRAEWVLNWAGDNVQIATQWHSVAGNYQELLNSRSRLDVSHRVFLQEWRAPLRKVMDQVDKADLNFADRDSLELLHRVVETLPTSRSLYAA